MSLELCVKLGLLVYVCNDLICPRRNVVLEADTLGGTRQLKAVEERSRVPEPCSIFVP